MIQGRTVVATFLSWWLAELRDTLGELRSRLAPQWRPSVTFYVSASRVQIVDPGASGHPEGLELAIGDLGGEVESEQAGKHGALASGRKVRVVFDPHLAFTRRLRMPLATLPHLESALELQKAKLLPQAPELLRTDFEIMTVDQDVATVEVELAALRLADIEPVENALHRWGLRIESMHVGRLTDARPRFRFDASVVRRKRTAMTRWELLLAGTAVILACTAVGVFAVQAVRAQRSLDHALAETTSAAAAVLTQREELISRLNTLALVRQSERIPTAAAVLVEITRRLNKDAWLTHFELQGSDLRLRGVGADPAALVTELGSSKLLTDVALRSSSSATDALSRERFEITARVRVGE